MRKSQTPSSFIMMTLEETVDLVSFMDAVMRRTGGDRGLLARVTLAGSVREDLETLAEWGRTQIARGRRWKFGYATRDKTASCTRTNLPS